MHEDKEPFTMQKRRGLIVWVYSLRQLKNLRRFGFVHYVSRKMKYVVMYLNEEEYESKKAYPVKDEGFDIEEKNTMIRLAENV